MSSAKTLRQELDANPGVVKAYARLLKDEEPNVVARIVADYLASEDAEKALAEALRRLADEDDLAGFYWDADMAAWYWPSQMPELTKAILAAWRERLQDTKGV